MNWKKILKYELPPPAVAGSDRNANMEAMNNWAKEFEGKLINQINSIETTHYLVIESGQVSIEGFSGYEYRKSIADFANEVKAWVRDINRNPGNYNYSQEIESLSRENDFIKRIGNNGNYISEFIKYLKL